MTTLADAFEAAARVRAVFAWAKQADDHVRAFIAAEIAAEKERSGIAPKYDVKGVCTAGWTQPNPQLQIDDRDALGKWGLRSGLSTKRPEVDGAALQYDLDGGQIPDVLFAALTAAGYIRDGWTFGKALADAADGWIDGGGQLITGDGEVVPGVRMVDRSSPQLRVVPAPAAVKRAAALLAGRLAPLELAVESEPAGAA